MEGGQETTERGWRTMSFQGVRLKGGAEIGSLMEETIKKGCFEKWELLQCICMPVDLLTRERN